MSGTVQPFVEVISASFNSGAASDVGKQRTRNEDSYLVHPESGIWAVADGMGGHDDGDVASAMVVEELRAIGRTESASELLRRCEEGLISANKRLLTLSQERGGSLIGTTVAILLTHDGHYACLWSGDSRVYRLRGGAFTQVSRDHTEVQEMVDDGRLTKEQAKTWPGRNVITRAIGVYDEPALDMEQGTLEPGDVFLICSDGLTGHVEDEEIGSNLAKESCQGACEALVKLTLERGARDNVTVVTVRYRPEPLAKPQEKVAATEVAAAEVATEEVAPPKAEADASEAVAEPPADA